MMPLRLRVAPPTSCGAAPGGTCIRARNPTSHSASSSASGNPSPRPGAPRAHQQRCQGQRRPPQQGPRVPPHTHRRRSTAHLMKSFVRTAVIVSRATIEDASAQTDTPSFGYFSQPNLCLLLDKASARFHSTRGPRCLQLFVFFGCLDTSCNY